MIVSALEEYAAGAITPQPQVDAEATYAKKIDKSETRIDWSEDSMAVQRRINAFAPWPGAWYEVAGERIKVLAAETVVHDFARRQPPSPSSASHLKMKTS